MKKKLIACLALAAPILVFAGCSGGTSRLTLSANWHADTNTTTGISGTAEHLEYTVNYEPEEHEGFNAEYEEGVYTADLRYDTYNGVACYYLETHFSITGRYVLGEEKSEDFTDTVTSKVYFMDVSTELRPLWSEKTVVSTSAVATMPSTLEGATETFAYTYTTAYNEDCTEAKVSIVYTQPDSYAEHPVEKTIDISGKGTYLDNETILFAMRGIATSAVSSFRTINPVTQAVTGCGMTAAPAVAETKRTFSVGGGAAQEHTLNAYTFSLGYSGAYSGQPQELTYAAKVTDGNTNTYRNVLLEMRVPTLQSLGTLVYKLKNADFGTK